MKFRICKVLILVFSLTGCVSSQFSVIEENLYSKNSDACALGVPVRLVEHLRSEAVKFCASRNETVIEEDVESKMGIPAVRCTSATLTFRCDPYKSEVSN
jgi:hypothetical protein